MQEQHFTYELPTKDFRIALLQKKPERIMWESFIKHQPVTINVVRQKRNLYCQFYCTTSVIFGWPLP